jgi:hypothetical protein
MACGQVPSGMISAVRASLAARALADAWVALHPGTPIPTDALAMAFAWAIGEGSFTHYYQGTNNFGSYHATSGFQKAHAADPGFGMVAFLDHNPRPYITRMRVYPSLFIGASGFLSLVDRDVEGLGTVSGPDDYATRTYVKGYYQGFHPRPGSGEPPVTPLAQRRAAAAAGTLNASDEANIADGVALLNCYLPEARDAMARAPAETGDPSIAIVGPFATLGERLTPGPRLVDSTGQLAPGTPHTLDRARAILGPYADSPPAGGISIADALASPNGDGAWMFTDAPLPAPGPSPKPAPLPTRNASGATFGEFALALALGAAGTVGAIAAFKPASIRRLVAA